MDQFYFPQSKLMKLRNNSIYTLSNKISFGSANNNSNNNTQHICNINFENIKINNCNRKSNNRINVSNEILRTKNKLNKNIRNKNDLYVFFIIKWSKI